MSDKPVKKFRVGNMSASVWKNDGTNNPFYTVTLQRSYKDGEDWKNTDSMGHGDLMNAMKALERAEAHIATLI